MNLDEAVKAIESLDDHIDLLVNNAAYTIHIENFLEVTEDEINKYSFAIVIFIVQQFTVLLFYGHV